MTNSTHNETPEQALTRIQSMGFGKNDALVIMAFAERGIAPEDIDPRNNVLTFNAWKAKGRCVAKGAISVRATVWIPCKPSKKQQAEGEEGKKLRPKTVSLFHISQTKPKGAPKDERPAAWQNAALVREGTYDAPKVNLREQFVEMREQELGIPADCTCPMAGVVTNVDCPQHGTRKAVTA